nr:hypothetical protein [Tanacetum cinerariifolium]
SDLRLGRRGDCFFAAWVWTSHWAGVLHVSALLERIRRRFSRRSYDLRHDCISELATAAIGQRGAAFKMLQHR